MTTVPAPFLRRLAARILDLAFCLILTFVIAVPLSVVYTVADIAVDEPWMEAWSTAVFVCTCYFTAYVGLEVFLRIRREGQTFGKGVMGLRVVPADPWARPTLEFGPSLTRMSMIFAPFVLMSLSGGHPEIVSLEILARVGMASIIIDLLLTAVPFAARRTLHDYAAGTRVVRSERRKIELKKDLPMLLPNKVSFAKN
ncbi:RDD family protein [Nocardia thailandica]